MTDRMNGTNWNIDMGIDGRICIGLDWIGKDKVGSHTLEVSFV